MERGSRRAADLIHHAVPGQGGEGPFHGAALFLVLVPPDRARYGGGQAVRSSRTHEVFIQFGFRLQRQEHARGLSLVQRNLRDVVFEHRRSEPAGERGFGRGARPVHQGVDPGEGRLGGVRFCVLAQVDVILHGWTPGRNRDEIIGGGRRVSQPELEGCVVQGQPTRKFADALHQPIPPRVVKQGGWNKAAQPWKDVPEILRHHRILFLSGIHTLGSRRR